MLLYTPMKRIYRVSPLILQAVIYAITVVLFKLFCGFKVSGLEHAKDLPEGVIFAANHSSEWDGILIRTALPYLWKRSPMYYVSLKNEHYTNSSWRQKIYDESILSFFGAYPAFTGLRDYAKSLRNHLVILRRGRSLTIFPEGQRTKDGTFSPARGGIAFLAHTTGVPVVPVAIRGMVRFGVREMFLRRRKVELIFGPAIPASELVPQAQPTADDYKAGAQRLMDTIASMVNERVKIAG